MHKITRQRILCVNWHKRKDPCFTWLGRWCQPIESSSDYAIHTTWKITAAQIEQFCNILRQTQHLHHLEIMMLSFSMPAVQALHVFVRKFSQMVHSNLLFFCFPWVCAFLGISHLPSLKSLNRWNFSWKEWILLFCLQILSQWCHVHIRAGKPVLWIEA